MAKKKSVNKLKPTKTKVNLGKEKKVAKEVEYGLIEETVVPKQNNEAFIRKVMSYLGYDLKRAANYRYYTKSSRPVKANFKETELEELFKNE